MTDDEIIREILLTYDELVDYYNTNKNNVTSYHFKYFAEQATDFLQKIVDMRIKYSGAGCFPYDSDPLYAAFRIIDIIKKATQFSSDRMLVKYAGAIGYACARLCDEISGTSSKYYKNDITADRFLERDLFPILDEGANVVNRTYIDMSMDWIINNDETHWKLFDYDPILFKEIRSNAKKRNRGATWGWDRQKYLQLFYDELLEAYAKVCARIMNSYWNC